MKVCCVVFGGYVNGYNIIRELYECGIRDIVLFDDKRKLASFSCKISRFIKVDFEPESLRYHLENLKKIYNLLVVFPTNEIQIISLKKIYKEVSSFCFLPFNPDNVVEAHDKLYQYAQCKRLGVPYPKTISIHSLQDIDKLCLVPVPFILKPVTREDIKTDVFRNRVVNEHREVDGVQKKLFEFIKQGIHFLASEIIPGDGSKIYAYCAYRSPSGKIPREWVGKKLSQFPDDYGVFSSASSEASEAVRELGRKLLNGINLYGICEPEFKLDSRDGEFKLMEINLRSMMWHRTGNRAGVKLQHAQYLDALGKSIPYQAQMNRIIHFVYMKHELLNFVNRRGYWRQFFDNLTSGDSTYFAIFDLRDPLPFCHDTAMTIRSLGKACLKRLSVI